MLMASPGVYGRLQLGVSSPCCDGFCCPEPVAKETNTLSLCRAVLRSAATHQVQPFTAAALQLFNLSLLRKSLALRAEAQSTSCRKAADNASSFKAKPVLAAPTSGRRWRMSDPTHCEQVGLLALA